MKPEYSLQTWVNNKILRSIAKPVDKITKDVKAFAKILLNKMYEYEGVGLAAPQIGISKRMIAVSFWKEKGNKTECVGDTVMINPVITRKSDEKFLFEEACLSLPGKRGEVLRHRHIKVSYQTVDGKQHIKKLSDMSAVIIQHEIDHLDGILFVDKTVVE
jgi:peptide deformylase